MAAAKYWNCNLFWPTSSLRYSGGPAKKSLWSSERQKRVGTSMDEQEESEFMAILETENFQTYPSDVSPINKDSDSKVQS